ncbi:serine/threonine-protein phosphatase 6 regulatory ankyrin repeat subunit C-like [Ceratina calcarata]|uniref:Serine/threonine-protein phosphatase 6 regulatory ankyrin repeat subunit C-like n=1 Tax=Ceratina calcarata TaxID=156304 RepID=A0AAJ7S8R5_9HYME|nr:serine/threonine-protein phosphatase 6 regulatory ankyrin repeat subunit C-like [Ceratina calcarata]
MADRERLYGEMMSAVLERDLDRLRELITTVQSLNWNINELPEIENVNRTTLLHMAVVMRQREIAELLITNGANVHAVDRRNYTPMHEAARNDDLEIMKLLMDNGANIANLPKLLFIAVKRASTEFVKLVLQHIDVNAIDSDGSMAIHSCVRRRPINYETLKLLIVKGANIDAKHNHTTALNLAARVRDINAVKLLLNNNADVNCKEEDGTTPLHIFVSFQEVEICKLLVKKGAYLNIKSDTRPPPLHVAVSVDNLDIMEILLRAGANVDCVDGDGNTALHLASNMPHDRLTATLLRYCSDINIVNQRNFTALEYALETTSPSFIVLLQHVIALQVAEFDVHALNIAAITKAEFRNQQYEGECKREFERMKNEKINNTNISFYDILIANINKFPRNEDVVNYLTLNNCETAFPIYGSMMKTRFILGVEKNKLIDESILACEKLFKHPDKSLPFTICVQICGYFCREEMRKLVEERETKVVHERVIEILDGRGAGIGWVKEWLRIRDGEED